MSNTKSLLKKCRVVALGLIAVSASQNVNATGPQSVAQVLTINAAVDAVIEVSPNGGPVTTRLSTLFPFANPTIFNAFNTSASGGAANSITANADYKTLMGTCRVVGAPASCGTIPPVFGTIQSTGVEESLRALNRMVVMNSNGVRRYENITVSNGVLSFDPTLIRDTEIAFIDVGYYQGISGTPFHRCDSEIVACGSKVTGCPSAQGNATCSPVIAGNNWVNANCACGPGETLTKCINNVPTCAPGCPPTQVRLTDGSCASEHKCSAYTSSLANTCPGTFQTFTAPASGPALYPASIVCDGTKAGCAPPSNCQMALNIANLRQPSSSTATDGTIELSTTGGTGNVNYTINPVAGTANAGRFDNLPVGNYQLTASDSSTPTACNQSTAVNLTVSSSSSSNSCQLRLTIGNVRQPTNPSASDGQMTITATGGSGTISYAISPSANSPTPGKYTGLQASAYTVTATDSTTPNACSGVININFASNSNSTNTDCSCYDNLYVPHTYNTNMYRWSTAFSVACFKGAKKYLPTQTTNGVCAYMQSDILPSSPTSGSWYQDAADETRNFGDCVNWQPVLGVQSKPACP